MKPAVKLVVGVAALALFVNCGSDDDDDNDDGSGGASGGSAGSGSAVAIDQVPALYAAAACEAYERCAGVGGKSGAEGRTLFSGTALYTESGRLCALLDSRGGGNKPHVHHLPS